MVFLIILLTSLIVRNMRSQVMVWRKGMVCTKNKSAHRVNCCGNLVWS